MSRCLPSVLLQNGDGDGCLYVCRETTALCLQGKKKTLTHLVLVRKVVGIQGLRRKEPPEERREANKCGLSRDHTRHRRLCSVST